MSIDHSQFQSAHAHDARPALTFGKRIKTEVETPWIVVEMLQRREMTVVSAGGEAREFVCVTRMIQRVVRAHGLAGHVTTAALHRHVRTVRKSGEPVSVLVNGGLHIVHVLPILGPHGRVHGVQFWLGPTDQQPPRPRPVVGAVWSLATRTMHQTMEGHRMAGFGDETFVPAVPIAVFWNRSVRFDDREQVFDLLYNPASGGKISTTGTVRRADGEQRLWQASIRSRNDTECVGAWGLLEDVTSDVRRPARATMEQEAFRAYHRDAGLHFALVDIHDAAIVHWLTDPPETISWKSAQGQVFAAADRARVVAAAENNDRIEVGVRSADGTYVSTSIALTPYQGECDRRLAIVKFIVAPDSSRGAAALGSRHIDNVVIEAEAGLRRSARTGQGAVR